MTKYSLISYSINFQDRTEQPHITKRRRTLATTATTEEEEEEVVATAGEDKEEAEDKVGGAVKNGDAVVQKIQLQQKRWRKDLGGISIPRRHDALLLLRSGRMTMR